ncbi:hypothetical protein [Agromyces sp. Root81]|uniref:hypothetical protein n=1 Tax=Agromyces sp. Root81 TaxID=1736601 RepID=UPI000A61A5D2|nr:hypothetical protein [Agromyces sp. Root81]
MAVPADWIAHRRRDGELLGWMRPDGDGFVVIDLLGRPVTEAVDWLNAEETLESTGIGYLAEVYELRLDDGTWLRVRITEVSSTAVRVKKDDFGAIDAPVIEHEVPFPITDRLRPLTGERAYILDL